jgi:branched-chain amino acid transport system permease protein
MGGYWANLLVVAGINAIAAWSLGLAIRSGQLSVGHAALAGIGGYAAGWLSLQGESVIVTVLFGMAFAGVLGVVLATLTLRLNHLFFALATLVFGEIAVIVVTNSTALGRAAGLVGMPLLDLRPWVAAILAVILLVELLVIRRSRLELQMAVVAHDPDLVEMSGTSARRMRVAVFGVSATVAGLAGVLHAYQIGVMQPVDLGFARSLDLLVYAVVGGASSGYGPIIGAFALTLLPEVLELEGNYATLLLGGVLLATMLIRKDGLVGRWPVAVTPRTSRRRRSGGSSDPPLPGPAGSEKPAPAGVR